MDNNKKREQLQHKLYSPDSHGEDDSMIIGWDREEGKWLQFFTGIGCKWGAPLEGLENRAYEYMLEKFYLEHIRHLLPKEKIISTDPWRLTKLRFLVLNVVNACLSGLARTADENEAVKKAISAHEAEICRIIEGR